MRSNPRQQRLNLFKRGNTRCPICLLPFAENDVRDGRSVTLEHAPPKAFRKDFNLKSIPLCLTCVECNNAAGRGMDQAAFDASRKPKSYVEVQGVPHTVSISIRDGAVPHIRMESRSLSFPSDLNPRDFKLIVKLQNPRCVNASWLKSAYLSVFSILGPYGYRYAEGDAVRQVRKQIMNPEKEIIKRIPLGDHSDRAGDWIFMNCESPRPCWAVNFGVCVVFLPTSWDTSFYDDPERFPLDRKIELGRGHFWKRSKFGYYGVRSVLFDNKDKLEMSLGANPFGSDIILDPDGARQRFVLADYRGQSVTMLPVNTQLPRN